jgi:O-antigen/teichoic acid export membrane protein
MGAERNLRGRPHDHPAPTHVEKTAQMHGPGISQLARPAAWLVAGALASRGATLVGTVILARLLGPNDFGIIALVQSLVAFLAGLAGLGLGIALTRRVAGTTTADPTAAGQLLTTALITAAAAALIVSAGYGLSRELISSLVIQRGDNDLVLASTGAVFFAGVTGTIQGGLAGLEAFRAVAVSYGVQAVAVTVGSVLGAWLYDITGGLAGMSVGYCLAAIVSHGLLTYSARVRGALLSWRLDRQACLALLHLAAPAALAFVVVYVALLIGQVQLAQESGYAEVGLFNFAYRWHLAILFLPAAVAPMLLPLLTRLLSERAPAVARRFFWLNLTANLLITAGPALILCLAAAPVLGLGGTFYEDHATPLIVLALASVPSAINNVLSSTAISFEFIRLWVLSDVVLAAVLVSVAASLISSSGASGLAVAYFAGYVATDVVLAIGLREHLRGA